MQYLLCAQLAADHCQIAQWCKIVNMEEGNKMHGYTDVDHLVCFFFFQMLLLEMLGKCQFDLKI